MVWFESGNPDEKDPDRHMRAAFTAALVQQAHFMILGTQSFRESAKSGSINVLDDREHRNALVSADPRVEVAVQELQIAYESALSALARLSESLEQVVESQQTAAADIDRAMHDARLATEQLSPKAITDDQQ